MELDGGTRTHRQHVVACELCGNAHLQAEHHRGSQPDSREHNPFTTTAASPYVDPRSPYINWTELYSTFNAGEANYRAFVFDATHRMQHGLYFDANYTLAYNKADNQGDAPTAFAGEVNYGLPIADRFHIERGSRQCEGTRRDRMLLTGCTSFPSAGAGI